eukprot:scaffold243882_cov57-Attheya_sp.AAC.2
MGGLQYNILGKYYVPSSIYIILLRRTGETTQNTISTTTIPTRVPKQLPAKDSVWTEVIQGIEAKDLESEQGAAKIQASLKHIRNDSTIGQASQILTWWAQMQAGTSKPILEDNQDIPYIENQWMVTLQHFMIQIQATIKEENPWVIRSAREHDQHIMDIVLQSPSIPEKDYAELNCYCRMYLRVTTLSDITTSDVKQIRDDILKGNRDLSNH